MGIKGGENRRVSPESREMKQHIYFFLLFLTELLVSLISRQRRRPLSASGVLLLTRLKILFGARLRREWAEESKPRTGDLIRSPGDEEGVNAWTRRRVAGTFLPRRLILPGGPR